ncbi:MAG: archaetidylserine decarboxylase [Casimicrobiaceae bacterium]
MNPLLQRLLPRRAVTELAGRTAAARGGVLTTWAIRRFIARYGVNMAEAAEPNPAAYPTFNDFFIRALRPGARPLCSEETALWACPVDGSVSQFGRIEGETGEAILQAKGHTYSTVELLGDNAALAEPFRRGHFATLYLSPKDYHRIHMPVAGTLARMLHVSGALYSVNPATAATRPRLFARNERVVCLFETRLGPLALVLVGATIVGSMQTVWHGVVNPPRPGGIREWQYPPGQVELARGAEMGRFLLGSTVILLWPAQPGGRMLRFNPEWRPGHIIRVGEPMATLD